MSQKPTKTLIRNIVSAIKKSKLKYLTVDRLSRLMGLYPEVLADALVLFEPMIKFDPSINTRDLLPQMEEYIAPKPRDPGAPKRTVVTKKELSEYRSIQDFVYQKFATVGGLIDQTAELDDKDLYTLKKLIEQEIAKRKRSIKRKHQSS